MDQLLDLENFYPRAPTGHERQRTGAATGGLGKFLLGSTTRSPLTQWLGCYRRTQKIFGGRKRGPTPVLGKFLPGLTTRSPLSQ